MNYKRYYEHYLKSFDLLDEYIYKICYLCQDLEKECENNNESEEYRSLIKDLYIFNRWQIYQLASIMAKHPYLHEDICLAFAKLKSKLTDAESDINAFVGFSNKKTKNIAEKKVISKRTVETHLRNIGKKIKNNPILYEIFMSDSDDMESLKDHLNPIKTIEKIWRIDEIEGTITYISEKEEEMNN